MFLSRHTLVLALGLSALGPFNLPGSPAQPQSQKPRDTTATPNRGDRALIVVGLPGDDDHAASFSELCRHLQAMADGASRLSRIRRARRVRRRRRAEPQGRRRHPRGDRIAEAIAIRKGLSPADRLWVIILGHANERGGHVFLHLPGPDLRDDELAKLFDGNHMPRTGLPGHDGRLRGFPPALSAKGRIVITATTADRELNETEFPHALADLCRQPPDDLDQDADGRVSVWEVFLGVGKLVEARFAADKRTPTEHALLDDNGDKVGIERPDPAQTQKDTWLPRTTKAPIADGELAKKTISAAQDPVDGRRTNGRSR